MALEIEVQKVRTEATIQVKGVKAVDNVIDLRRPQVKEEETLVEEEFDLNDLNEPNDEEEFVCDGDILLDGACEIPEDPIKYSEFDEVIGPRGSRIGRANSEVDFLYFKVLKAKNELHSHILYSQEVSR